MLAIQTSFYAMSVCLCLFTGMLVWRMRSKFSVRYFMLFLLIQGFSSVSEWLMATPDTSYKGLWLLNIMTLALFCAPCLWLFARDMSTKQHDLKRVDIRVHCLPIVIGVLLLVPLASSIHTGSSFNNEVDPLTTEYTFFLHTSMLSMAGVFFLQSIYYFKRCLSFTQRRISQNKSLFAHTCDSGVNALRVLTLVVIANFIMNVSRVLYCWVLDDISVINLSFAFLHLFLVGYLCFSVVEHALSYQPHNNKTRETLFGNESSLSQQKVQKYQNSALDSDRRAVILEKIESLFNDQKYYRDSRLNLDGLCKKLGDIPYVVSQAINQSHYQNFYSLVNLYRIEEAKLLLLQNPHHPILEIAYSVGYNSKSTFNTSFKKLVEMSPSEYRKIHSKPPLTEQINCQ